MAAIKQISGSQASYANLASQSGLTYVATTRVPPGSSAEGVLRSAENVAATFRIDALASVAPSVGNHYWVKFWVRGIRGAGAAPTNKSDYGLFAWDGTRFLTFKFATNADGSVGWTPQRGDANVAGGTADGIMVDAGPEVVKIWGSIDNNEGWCRVDLHVERHGTTGKWRLFIDGVLFDYKVSINTDQLWTTGLNANSFLITLPQWVGAYWEVAGPIESWNETNVVITPEWGLLPSNALATRLLLPFATAQAGGLTQGCLFQVSGTGTVAVDPEYLNQSGSPCRHRHSLAGNGNAPVVTTIPKLGPPAYNEQGWAHVPLSDLLVPTSGYAVWQINKDNGSPLFRFFVTNGSLFVSYDTGQYVNVAVWTHATVRYSIILHLNKDGRAAFTLIDLTSNPGTANNVTTTTSRGLPDWTPQDLGTVSLTAGPTANPIESGFMGLYRRPTLYGIDSIATAAHTPASGNTTVIQNSGCVMRSLPSQRECQCLPGSHWPLRNLGLERHVPVAPLGRSGLTRREVSRNALAPLLHTFGCFVKMIDAGSVNDIATIGTGDDGGVLGMLFESFEQMLKWAVERDNAIWVATMLPRGRTFTISGISAADPAVVTLSAGHGMPTGSTYRFYLSGVVGNATMQNAVNGKLFQNSSATVGGSTFTLPTIANGGPNTSGGTYTSGGTVTGWTPQELAAITKFNAFIRDAVRRWQRNGLIYLSDIEADAAANPANYPNNSTFYADPTHPSTGTAATNGAQVIATAMVRGRSQPPSTSVRRRWPQRLLGR